ncbi:hypothetical protein QTP70_025614, partial [Hemibagrus guttatus]
SEEKKEPEYYKLQSEKNEEFCLATRFTVQNATFAAWPTSKYPADAVQFEDEGYYSRLMLKSNETCDETESTCDHKKEDSSNFQSGDTIPYWKTWMNFVLST